MKMISWEICNSEESFLPFYMPLGFWLSCYFIGKSKGIEFHDWTLLHNAHNLTTIGLGMASLYFNDDAIFNERIPILFSLSYFLLDFVDCIFRRDYAYTAHAFFCITLGIGNYTTPICRTLRTNSKACLTEISSPFLHVAKKTRTPWHFLLFVVVFTCCRMIWLPIMMKQIHDGGLPFLKDIRQLLLLGFYFLNCFWYYKMLRIVFQSIRGGEGSTAKAKAKNE